MNNFSNEEKEELSVFSKQSATPDRYFKDNLKRRFLNEYLGSPRIFLGLTAPQFAFAVFSISIISLTFVGFRFLGSIQNKTNAVQTYSTEQKQVAIEKVIQNNPSALLIKPDESSLASSQSGKAAPVEPAVAPADTRLNYRHTEITTTLGNAYSTCKVDGINNQTEQLDEIFESSQKVVKQKIYDSKQELTDYQLTTFSAADTETILYEGGSYAVKLVQQNTNGVASYPVSYLSQQNSSDTAMVENVVQKQSTLQLVTRLDGTQYFLLEVHRPSSCLTTSPASYPSSYPVQSTLIYQYQIDPITYSISQLSVYLNNATDNNLIYRTTTSIQTSSVSQVQANSISQFEFSVDTKLVTNIQDTKQGLFLNFLKENNVQLFYPSQSVVAQGSITKDYVDPNWSTSHYYLDQNFYSTASYTKNNIQQLKTSILSYDKYPIKVSYTIGNDQILISIYLSSQDKSDENLILDPTKTADINIGGKNYVAFPVASQQYCGSLKDCNTYDLELGGSSYIISFTGGLNPTNTQFRSLNLVTDLNIIDNLIQ